MVGFMVGGVAEDAAEAFGEITRLPSPVWQMATLASVVLAAGPIDSVDTASSRSW